jgi:Co/Zn/Cd efflux system component
VIIEKDESDAGVFLGSVHESIAIFVFAIFFPFKSLGPPTLRTYGTQRSEYLDLLASGLFLISII